MKKILTVSLVAMMAVTTARAEIASKAYVDQREAAAVSTANTYTDTKVGDTSDWRQTGDTSDPDVATAIARAVAGAAGDASAAIADLDATVTQAAGADGLALSVTQTDGVVTAVSGSIAANTYEPYGAASTAIAALDATESQTAGADGLALSVTEVDGVITGISGSIAANTYDAYGSASTAESNAATYTDTAIGTLPTNPSTSQPYADVVTYVGAVASTANGAVQDVSNGTSTTGNGTITVDGSAVTVYGLQDLAFLDTVDTAQIDDSAVTTAKINDSAVTTAKINDGAVTLAKLSATLPTACQASGTKDCALVSHSGVLAWEQVERATNETALNTTSGTTGVSSGSGTGE